MIICGFPGVGKSYYSNQNSTTTDSDSSKFSWLEPGVRNPDFPSNYIRHIQSFPVGHVVLVSTHEAVRQSLINVDLPFYLCYPSRHCKEEYISRYKTRGSSDSFLSLLDKMWDTWIDEMEQCTCSGRFILTSGQYLSDALNMKPSLSL